jgi:hypothetical protein
MDLLGQVVKSGEILFLLEQTPRWIETWEMRSERIRKSMYCQRVLTENNQVRLIPYGMNRGNYIIY